MSSYGHEYQNHKIITITSQFEAIMSDLKLTQKQERFTRFLFDGLSQREAWIKAGYSSNYAPAIIDTHACVLAKSDKVKIRLAELNAEADNKSVMSVLERKQRLTEIARPRITDFMELGQDGSWVNIGPETPNSGAISEIHSRTEYDEDGAHPTVHTSVKLHNPVQAIQELNKMEKIYSDAPVFQENRQVNFVFVLPDGTRIAPSKLTGNNTQKQLLPPDK
ncbi:MAG: terminase small subunit [Eubacteriales bacterium]